MKPYRHKSTLKEINKKKSAATSSSSSDEDPLADEHQTDKKIIKQKTFNSML